MMLRESCHEKWLTEDCKMRALHISNGFCGSKVHANLCQALDELGVEQVVYCPVRKEIQVGKNQFGGQGVSFVYSYCIRPWYKYVYHYKKWQLYHDMKKRIDLSQFDVIHAATLFSDGGLAYKAYKEFEIPYMVTVRNTDINLFIAKLWHTHTSGRKILKHASKIIFISPATLEKFKKTPFAKPVLKAIEDKFVVQPNGIEDLWIQHVTHEHRGGHQLLYIGDFTPNKNVCRLIEAVSLVRKISGYEDTSLSIVGGGNDKNGRTEKCIKEHEEFVDYKGIIHDKDRLKEIMSRCSLFAMASVHETFGLVYIEALSQNLPIIYTLGQGVDGLFDETVGIGVHPKSVEEIRDAIITILSHPEKYGNFHVNFDDFNWKRIAAKYMQQYKEIVRSE